MSKKPARSHGYFHQNAEERVMPGAFGDNRDQIFVDLDAKYGQGNWQFFWVIGGETWGFDQMFWKVYVEGYKRYFDAHRDEAAWLAANFSFAYDLDPIPWSLAFDPHALRNKPGRPNQFHHVALNYAITEVMGGWCGVRPIQVRGPGTEGEKWNPGHIPAPAEFVRQILPVTEGWWESGSVEDLYQKQKVLLVLPQDGVDNITLISGEAGS